MHRTRVVFVVLVALVTATMGWGSVAGMMASAAACEDPATDSDVEYPGSESDDPDSSRPKFASCTALSCRVP